MKFAFYRVSLLVLTVFLNLTDQAWAANPPVREFSAARYTDIGSDMVFAELGTLSVDNGFTISSSFEAFRSHLAIESATLTAISGKFVVRKDQVDFLRQIDPTVLILFEFSAESYAAANFPVYITNVAGAGKEPPSVSIRASQLSLRESKSQKSKVTFSLDELATKDTVIHFKFTGNATLGRDFKSSAAKTVKIAKGQKNATITLTALNDTIDEPIEKIVCEIRKGAGYKLAKSARITLRIRK
jgi:hypothetical protein